MKKLTFVLMVTLTTLVGCAHAPSDKASPAVGSAAGGAGSCPESLSKLKGAPAKTAAAPKR